MTTELSQFLTYVLPLLAQKSKYCEKVFERSSKNLFWSIKNSGEVLDKLISRNQYICV